MRVAPLQQAIMLDLGARVSSVPRRQISAFPPAYSKLNHWTPRHVRRKIQWHGHVELNLRRAQEFVQVGARWAQWSSVATVSFAVQQGTGSLMASWRSVKIWNKVVTTTQRTGSSPPRVPCHLASTDSTKCLATNDGTETRRPAHVENQSRKTPWTARPGRESRAQSR